MAKYCILHLSDLHRDVAEELGNQALIESLSRDLVKFGREHPGIDPPAICLVTGDLVYGVKPFEKFAKRELERQYAQAETFLTALCDEFFGGDRDKVVILPGNHDISFVDVVESASRIDPPTDAVEKAALVEELFRPQSKLRWSWRDLCFYRITDEKLYEGRLDNFAQLQSRFYHGKRLFQRSPKSQISIFDFGQLNLTVVALNSCYNNDPFNRMGSIHPSCIAECSKILRSGRFNGRLIAAAWHHNIAGSPKQNDYLDSEVLQHFIDCGVSLGFHGHRHSSLYITEKYQFGDPTQKITVIGAGTLCAGPSGLNPGEPRSYNLVEIDTEIWSGRLFRRNMLNQGFEQPIWGAGLFPDGRAAIDFPISEPKNVRPGNLDEHLRLEEASRLLAERNWQKLLELMQSLSAFPNARPFLRRALSELADYRQIIELLWPPQTLEEMVMLGGAILNAWNPALGSAFLELEAVRNSDDASVRDVKQRIENKLS